MTGNAAPSVLVSPPSTGLDASRIVQERWSESNFDAMVKLWKFNAVDQEKMRELQFLLQDIDHWKNDPYEVARYLKDFHKLPAPKIAEIFRRMVEWRQANQVDAFCGSYGTPPEIFQYFPCYLLKDLDHDGDPIFINRVGVLDAWGMYQKVGADAVVEYFLFLQEMITTRHMQGVPQHWNWQTEYYEPLVGNNRRMTQLTTIVDVEGLSSRHLRPALFGILKKLARGGQDYYAGARKRIIILRAPRIFQIGWNVCKHFFDPHVIELITITTPADYLQVCDQYLDRKALPACMCPEGGQGQAMPGYFESVRLEGGMIPNTIGVKSFAGLVPGSAHLGPGSTNDTFDLSIEDDDNNSQIVDVRQRTSIKLRSPVAPMSAASLLSGSFDPLTCKIAIVQTNSYFDALERDSA